MSTYGYRWRQLRAAVLARDHHVCRWCGAPATQVDHVLPVVHGGTDDPANLVASCAPCNLARGARTGNALRGRYRRAPFFEPTPPDTPPSSTNPPGV